MRNKVLLILPLLLAPALAQGYFRTYNTESFISGFFEEYSTELTSMAMAAIAAIGLQMSFKKSKYFDARELNMVTLAMFITFFIFMEYSGAYAYFLPFLGYLFIIGTGLLIFAIYKGLGEVNAHPIDKFVAAFGCFFLSWFAYMAGLIFASMALLIAGIILVLYGLPGFEGFGAGKSSSASKAEQEEEEEFEKIPDVADDDEYNNILSEVKTKIKEFINKLEEIRKKFADSLFSLTNPLSKLIEDNINNLIDKFKEENHKVLNEVNSNFKEIYDDLISIINDVQRLEKYARNHGKKLDKFAQDLVVLTFYLIGFKGRVDLSWLNNIKTIRPKTVKFLNKLVMGKLSGTQQYSLKNSDTIDENTVYVGHEEEFAGGLEKRGIISATAPGYADNKEHRRLITLLNSDEESKKKELIRSLRERWDFTIIGARLWPQYLGLMGGALDLKALPELSADELLNIIKDNMGSEGTEFESKLRSKSLSLEDAKEFFSKLQEACKKIQLSPHLLEPLLNKLAGKSATYPNIGLVMTALINKAPQGVWTINGLHNVNFFGYKLKTGLGKVVINGNVTFDDNNDDNNIAYFGYENEGEIIVNGNIEGKILLVGVNMKGLIKANKIVAYAVGLNMKKDGRIISRVIKCEDVNISQELYRSSVGENSEGDIKANEIMAYNIAKDMKGGSIEADKIITQKIGSKNAGGEIVVKDLYTFSNAHLDIDKLNEALKENKIEIKIKKK